MAWLNWLAIWAVNAVGFCLWLFSVAYEAAPIESRWSPSVAACQYLIDLHLVQWNYWFNLCEADQQEEESFIAWAITEVDSSICTALVSPFFLLWYWDNWPIGQGVVEGSEPYGRSCFYGYSHLLDALWKSWAAGPLSPPLSSLLPALLLWQPCGSVKRWKVLLLAGWRWKNAGRLNPWCDEIKQQSLPFSILHTLC